MEKSKDERLVELLQEIQELCPELDSVLVSELAIIIAPEEIVLKVSEGMDFDIELISFEDDNGEDGNGGLLQ